VVDPETAVGVAEELKRNQSKTVRAFPAELNRIDPVDVMPGLDPGIHHLKMEWIAGSSAAMTKA
jgi:hypothetical protein